MTESPTGRVQPDPRDVALRSLWDAASRVHNDLIDQIVQTRKSDIPSFDGLGERLGRLTLALARTEKLLERPAD